MKVSLNVHSHRYVNFGEVQEWDEGWSIPSNKKVTKAPKATKTIGAVEADSKNIINNFAKKIAKFVKNIVRK